MASCVFILRPGKRGRKASVYVRIQGRNPHINIRQTTHLTVDPAIWSMDRQSRPFRNYRDSEEGKTFFGLLRQMEMAINARLCGGQSLSAADTRAIINGVLWHGACREGTTDLNAYAEQYMADICAGRRMTIRGTRFSPTTIASLRVSIRRFQDFQKVRRIRLDYERMDTNVFRDYIHFLQQDGLRANYIRKLVSDLKALLNCAAADGYPVHPCCHHRISGIGMTEVDSVYLTRPELERIQQLDLSGLPRHFALSRDVFLIGVWTAQRVSDYNHLENSCLHYESLETGKSVPTLHIIQKKTRKRVIIPCSTGLLSILKRYPDQPPSVPDYRLNRDIKIIARLAGINDPVEVRSCVGGEIKRSVIPKYELVHSHTARRTGATLMYLSGMNVYDICHITGHASVQMLRRYIKANALETVRKIKSAYRYFD